MNVTSFTDAADSKRPFTLWSVAFWIAFAPRANTASVVPTLKLPESALASMLIPSVSLSDQSTKCLNVQRVAVPGQHPNKTATSRCPPIVSVSSGSEEPGSTASLNVTSTSIASANS